MLFLQYLWKLHVLIFPWLNFFWNSPINGETSNGKKTPQIQKNWPSAAAAIVVPLYLVGDSAEHEAFVIGEAKMLDLDSSKNLLNILQFFRDCQSMYLHLNCFPRQNVFDKDQWMSLVIVSSIYLNIDTRSLLQWDWPITYIPKFAQWLRCQTSYSHEYRVPNIRAALPWIYSVRNIRA